MPPVGGQFLKIAPTTATKHKHNHTIIQILGKEIFSTSTCRVEVKLMKLRRTDVIFFFSKKCVAQGKHETMSTAAVYYSTSTAVGVTAQFKTIVQIDLLYSRWEDMQFKSASELNQWLQGRGLDKEDADEAAEILFGIGFKDPDSLLDITVDELERAGLKNSIPLARLLSNKLKNDQGKAAPEDHKRRFRQLAEDAAINVSDAVMKSVVFHFASQMIVITTPEEAGELYKRASRIPGSAAEIELKEKNISIGEICPGTDTSKSIILEAFEDGSPCLLKMSEKENIEHEMTVWAAIDDSASVHDKANLVPLKKLDFKKAADVQVKNLGGRYNKLEGDYKAGILMEKYQSALSRCKILLTEEVLLRYGEQLKTAICTMHACGYCHMDIKPANIFISKGGNCHLGDYGGATRIGEAVREHTVAYYPSDAGRLATEETDFLLLAVTLLEMYGYVPSPPLPMSRDEIKAAVAKVGNDNVRAFLNQLL